MSIKYSEKEIAALNEKEQNIENTVFCPRCGSELVYSAIGNSYEIKCPTAECIKKVVRGL